MHVQPVLMNDFAKQWRDTSDSVLGAFLRGASLGDANLHYACLGGAFLSRAVLSGAVLKAAFEVSFRPDPALLAGTPLAVALLAAAAGLAVSVRALRVRPLEVLRGE